MNNKLELCIDPEDAQELAASCDSEKYKVIEINLVDEWRWGTVSEVIFQDFEENYWAFTYKESVGDEYWSSIDDSETDSVTCYRVKPVEVTVIKYEKATDESL